MKKHLVLYLLFFSSLPCFAQYFRTGDVQLGYKITRQKPLQLFGDRFDFSIIQKRQMLVAEYHIIENVSFYATFDTPHKTSFFNENEKINTNSKFKAFSVGGRWFSTGLFHGHLYLYGDLGYGQFNVSKSKIDAIDKFELEKIDEQIHFSGFAGGICIKPSTYLSIDINLLRIGALEQIFTINKPFEEPLKIYKSRFLLGRPLSVSDYDGTSIRFNFIFSTQKNKTNE